MLLRCCAWAGGKRKVSNGIGTALHLAAAAAAVAPNFQESDQKYESMGTAEMSMSIGFLSLAFHSQQKHEGPYFTYYVKYWFFCSAVLLASRFCVHETRADLMRPDM